MTHNSTHSEQIAEALRDAPPALDDLARARMERAWTASCADGSTPRDAGSRRAFSASYFALGVGLGFAAAAVLFLMWQPAAPHTATPVALGPAAPSPAAPSPAAPSPAAPSPAATGATPRLERWTADRDSQVTAISEGQVVTTRAEERARLSLGATQIELSPGSRLVPERLASDLRLRLERGEVRVEFNPEHPGEESMVVETLAARVEVVGTAFRVRVSSDGSTLVSVEHGVVRVTTLPFGDTRELRAGESLHVAPRSARRTERFALPTPPHSVESAPLGVRADGVVQALTEPDGPPGPEPTTSEAPSVEVPAEATPTRVPGPPLDADARFALASRLSERRRYEQARHELYAIVRRGRPLERSRAWSLVADTREREHDWSAAGEAYRRAAEASPRSGFGRTALFSLGRLRELRLHDRDGARNAYDAYLSGPGQAPLAEQARHALCRLGDLVRCSAGEEPTEAPPTIP